MAINKKGVFETLQHKISNIDSNSSTSVIIDTLKAVKKADHNTIISYADSSDLPTASASNYRLAYVTNVGQLRFNNGLQWDKLQTQLPDKYVAPAYGGTQYGYQMAGYPRETDVNRWSFTSDGNATTLSNATITDARHNAGSGSSSTHAYVIGGNSPGEVNTIDKFAFADDGAGTDVGDLTAATQRLAVGGCFKKDTAAYAVGGRASGVENKIEKILFATDGNATDIADLTQQAENAATAASTTHGYRSAGEVPPSYTLANTIDKFPFASEDNATDVGDITVAVYRPAGAASTDHYYTHGGQSAPSTYSNVINKVTFSSDGNATDVGDLLTAIAQHGGVSSTTHGYAVAGRQGSPSPSITTLNVIQKFAYSADGNATDVGDLTRAQNASPAGAQN